MIKSVGKLSRKELENKKIFLRVDFNVPVSGSQVLEAYRIRAIRETVDFLISNRAITCLVSHITAAESFGPISNQIKEILGVDFNFIDDCVGELVAKNLNSAKPGDVFLLENVRKYEGEEKNDTDFAKSLAKPFNIYINDAFSASHRKHASLVAITSFLPSYSGFLIIREIEKLNSALNMSEDGKTLVLGGAKIETKFPVIKNFLDKAENILIGGAIANVFLKANGIDIKKSLTDDKFLEEANKLLKNSNLTIPADYIMAGDMILDIGPKTIENFVEFIKKSKLIVWNGPVGKFEENKFSVGSKKIAEAIIDCKAFSIVGGGDTIAFLEKIGLVNRFSYVSTGGGAMLEFLAGNKLPGLVALGYVQ